MKKKGFTLIELLAVIVILAIIALIATPLVLKYIEYSKEKSAKLSANTYAEAVEKEYVSKLTNNEKMDNKEYSISELDELGVKVKGDKPEGTSDYVTLQNGNVIEYKLTIKGYTITYKDGKTSVESEKDSDSDSKKINALDYTVTFNIDGKPYEIVSVTEGSTVKEPTIPTKDGYKFNYWVDSENKNLKFPFTPTNDMDVNALFTKNTKAEQIIESFGINPAEYEYVFIAIRSSDNYINYIAVFNEEQLTSNNLTLKAPYYYNMTSNKWLSGDLNNIDDVVNYFVNNPISLIYNGTGSGGWSGNYSNYHHYTNCPIILETKPQVNLYEIP